MSTISQLPAATGANATDLLPITQSGVTCGVTVGQLTAGPLAAAAAARALAAGAVASDGGDSSATTIAPYSSNRVRTQVARARDVANVLDFAGIDPSGNNDSTSAIALALAQAGEVYFPSGSYAASQLTLPSYKLLRGAGFGTRLLCFSTTGDFLAVGDGTNVVRQTTLRDMTLSVAPGVVRTAGKMARFRLAESCGTLRVWVGTFADFAASGTYPFFGGVSFEGFGTCFSSGGGVLGCQDDGLVICGANGQTFGAEFDFGDGCAISNNLGAGVRIAGSAGGVYLNRSNVQANLLGVVIDTSMTGLPNREIFDRGCIADSNEQQNFWVKANSISGILEVPEGWACGAQTPGVASFQVDANSCPVLIGKLTAYGSKGPGVLLNGGTVVAGEIIATNNGQGNQGGSGLVMGPTCLGLTAANIKASANGSGAAGYGLDLFGATAGYAVSGDARGNTSGSIKPGEPDGQNNVIIKMLGYVSVNEGAATVPSGSESIVVAHGLTEQPASVAIWRYGPADGGAEAYVDIASINATTFTLHNGATAAAIRAFGWRASRNPGQ